MNNNTKNRICKTCEKQFVLKKIQQNKGKYCSQGCQRKSLIGRIITKREIINCKNCGIEVQFLKSQEPERKFCSQACKIDNQRFYGKVTEEKQLERLKNSFEQRVIRSEAGCWGWNGLKNNKGYGWLPFKNRHFLAHRASWILHNGEIPKGLIVCHHCDTPECTRPFCLFLGTQKDNVQDAKRKQRMKGQFKKGNIPASRILTEKQVEFIKGLINQSLPLEEIGELFNVSRDCIKDIKTGKTWSHITI